MTEPYKPQLRREWDIAGAGKGRHDRMGLAGIFSESGLNAKLKPFVQIQAKSETGLLLTGQVDVKTCRELALQLLEIAEGAESDAIVCASLMEDTGIDQETALQFIAGLRHRRMEQAPPK